MANIQFDQFYKYEELTTYLESIAQEYAGIYKLVSIGKSFEDRDIWVAIITNFNTGPDLEKPAFWVDGNIHATEVSASTACLYHINKLVTSYGKDEAITRCIDTRVFYICPRLNPDGAEWALADQPKFIRSSTRPYPFDEEPLEGLIAGEDIDGDGRILSMRIKDPNGSWKPHPNEPRLMIHRDPIETGGDYYRIFPEGRIRNYDGYSIQVQRPKEGLDLNRNFPIEWRQENEQKGAGPYPTSEPEVRAMVEFITKHNNISGVVTFHTYSGVLLRPSASQSDDTLPVEDLWTYKKLGKKGTEITGYPNISIFHDFKYHPNQVITGGSDWVYDHMGMFFWAVELWSPMRQAGIEDYSFIDWFREHPPEDDLAILKWNDEVLEGKGFINWYDFNHPELGPVELGGWDTLHYWKNPPPDLLEKEIKSFPDWLVWHALISPKLELEKTEVHSLGNDNFQISAYVVNTGWLPTYVTKKALQKKVVRGIIAELALPENAVLKSGKVKEEFSQLEGRAYKTSSDADDSTCDRIKLEWIVKAASGNEIELTIRHERAGVIRSKFLLEN